LLKNETENKLEKKEIQKIEEIKKNKLEDKNNLMGDDLKKEEKQKFEDKIEIFKKEKEGSKLDKKDDSIEDNKKNNIDNKNINIQNNTQKEIKTNNLEDKKTKLEEIKNKSENILIPGENQEIKSENENKKNIEDNKRNDIIKKEEKLNDSKNENSIEIIDNNLKKNKIEEKIENQKDIKIINKNEEERREIKEINDKTEDNKEIILEDNKENKIEFQNQKHKKEDKINEKEEEKENIKMEDKKENKKNEKEKKLDFNKEYNYYNENNSKDKSDNNLEKKKENIKDINLETDENKESEKKDKNENNIEENNLSKTTNNEIKDEIKEDLKKMKEKSLIEKDKENKYEKIKIPIISLGEIREIKIENKQLIKKEEELKENSDLNIEEKIFDEKRNILEMKENKEEKIIIRGAKKKVSEHFGNIILQPEENDMDINNKLVIDSIDNLLTTTKQINRMKKLQKEDDFNMNQNILENIKSYSNNKKAKPSKLIKKRKNIHHQKNNSINIDLKNEIQDKIIGERKSSLKKNDNKSFPFKKNQKVEFSEKLLSFTEKESKEDSKTEFKIEEQTTVFVSPRLERRQIRKNPLKTFKSQRNLKLNPKNNKDFEIDENKKFHRVMTANPDKEIQLSFFLEKTMGMPKGHFYVSGNHKDLGDWEIKKALRLKTKKRNGKDFYCGYIIVKKNNFPLEYKYFIKIKKGEIVWIGKAFENYIASEEVFNFMFTMRQKRTSILMLNTYCISEILNYGNSWKNRKEYIIPFILKGGSDIILFQDINRLKYHFIHHRIDAIYEFIGVDKEDYDNNQYNLIAYNKKNIL
jgi:hypothetical protein